MEEFILTTRGRYAVMAMIELGNADDSAPLTLAEIAERRNISVSYMEQLFRGLRDAGLVQAYRGPGGGYRPTRPAKDIMINDIVAAAEQTGSSPAIRLGKKGRRNPDREMGMVENCPSLSLWSLVGNVIYKSLSRISLHDVIHNRLPQNTAVDFK